MKYEIDGGEGSLSWDSEEPNRLLIGHRDRANEVLDKSPALLSPAARMLSAYPGGHRKAIPTPSGTYSQPYTNTYPPEIFRRRGISRPSKTATAKCSTATPCSKALISGQWVEVRQP